MNYQCSYNMNSIMPKLRGNFQYVNKNVSVCDCVCLLRNKKHAFSRNYAECLYVSRLLTDIDAVRKSAATGRRLRLVARTFLPANASIELAVLPVTLATTPTLLSVLHTENRKH